MSSGIAVGTESRAAHFARLRAWVVPLLILALLGAALHAMEAELARLRYHDIMRAFRALPHTRLLLALGCTVLSYAVLPGYDLLALAYAGRRLPWYRTAYGSLIAYGLSQTLGFPALTGGSVRVRLWSAWGLETTDIARAVAFAGGTFSFGVVALTGVVGLVEPGASLEHLHLPVALVRGLSVVCVVLAGLYVIVSLTLRVPALGVGRWRVAFPTPRLVMGQLAVATIDWVLAALVLYVLLPEGHGVRFPAFVGVFLLAQTIGLLSHVPGGLGVFETVMVLQVGGAVPTERLLGALVAYRVVFYLIPFGVALALLSVHEARRQRERLSRAAVVVAESFERWGEPLLPTAMGMMTIVGGAMLLLSGATPPVRGRMLALVQVLPLGVVELSHFAGSIAGSGLLVLGWALTRRLDAAFHLARGVVIVGIVASLLKGFDYEEAAALTAVLILLQLSRGAFYRKSSLLAETMTPGWIAAIVAVVAVSVWVGLFSFKHVEYSGDLWWHFAERGDAPRFLRSSAGAAAMLGVIGAMRLLRHARALPEVASAEQLSRVATLLPQIQDTAASLALLGDKHLMLTERQDGFLMYGVNGRSWVALGDPCGSEEAMRELAWRFREAADEHGAFPVFYEVSARHLPLYIDLGLTLLKLGEEAVVELQSFSLEGAGRKGLRRTKRDMQKAGASLEIVPASGVPALLPALKAVSDAWLRDKATREKGFSLGRFDEGYLSHFPAAVVRINHEIVAFANVWLGNGSELSVDLMRYNDAAPPGVMEYLFIELMLWGKAQGYERMSLGMAPLSGLEARALAPRWHRLGSLLYRHGEHYYNFQGLRRYKEKFDPVWEPRYLATPAGLVLPRVIANVASLISGGIAGIFAK